jgi:hypothetical protein
MPVVETGRCDRHGAVVGRHDEWADGESGTERDLCRFASPFVGHSSSGSVLVARRSTVPTYAARPGEQRRGNARLGRWRLLSVGLVAAAPRLVGKGAHPVVSSGGAGTSDAFSDVRCRATTREGTRVRSRSCWWPKKRGDAPPRPAPRPAAKCAPRPAPRGVRRAVRAATPSAVQPRGVRPVPRRQAQRRPAVKGARRPAPRSVRPPRAVSVVECSADPSAPGRLRCLDARVAILEPELDVERRKQRRVVERVADVAVMKA